MFFKRRQLTPKARRLLAAGNVCLFTGCMLTLLGKDFAHYHAALYDALRGFLIGLALTFNFAAFRFAQRCPNNQPGPKVTA
jgi:hypothetical protein